MKKTFGEIIGRYKNSPQLLLYTLLGLVTAIAIVCIFSFALHRDIFFHTDIARDFLLVEQMIDTKRPSLIGARSGGIPGLFHGPLWLYMSIPAFIITQENPGLIAIWWGILNVSIILSCYWIAKKIFTQAIGLYAASIMSVMLITTSANLTNPFGAMMFSPWVLFFWYQYLQTKKWQYLAACFLVIGITIQFQIAFGGPLLLVILAGSLFLTIKHKLIHHMLSFFAVFIPLSTYIVFDLRNNFLQSRSVLNFILNREGESLSFSKILAIFLDRLYLASIDMMSIIPSVGGNPVFRKIGPILILILCVAVISKIKKSSYKDWFASIAFLYLGYWVIALVYPGTMWVYYYNSFLPIIVLGIASAAAIVPKKIFLPILFVILSLTLVDGILWSKNLNQFVGKSDLSWQSYNEMAQDIYNTAQGDFGYYIYTPDLYGYQPKYAMQFMQNRYQAKQSYSFQKKREVFLIMASAPKDKPYLNGNSWKENDIAIHTEPLSIKDYPNGFTVEHYILSDEQIAVPSNPLLIQDLHFR
mgnify:CR=1 FL=1